MQYDVSKYYAYKRQFRTSDVEKEVLRFLKSDQSVSSDRIILCALGYERNPCPFISFENSELSQNNIPQKELLDTYNRTLGSIGPADAFLFGAGIAFPQHVVDAGGNRGPWVGFKRSILQTDLMVNHFLDTINL